MREFTNVAIVLRKLTQITSLDNYSIAMNAHEHFSTKCFGILMNIYNPFEDFPLRGICGTNGKKVGVYCTVFRHQSHRDGLVHPRCWLHISINNFTPSGSVEYHLWNMPPVSLYVCVCMFVRTLEFRFRRLSSRVKNHFDLPSVKTSSFLHW